MHNPTFLEALKIINEIPNYKISPDKIIEKCGEDELVRLLANGFTCIDISVDDTLKLFLKKNIIKKSQLKPEVLKRLKLTKKK